jgi:phosphatidylinositol alpha-1,6-mannosyltransferase
MPDLLFAHDFPPMGGGIARWMEALARGYPSGDLVVSTGAVVGSAAADASLPQRVDRVSIPSERLRLVPSAIRWSLRGVSLAREVRARFAWCDSVRPAGHPGYWARRLSGVPYGIVVHGGDILTLRARVATGAFKRRLMRAILADASVYVANSHWSADQCRALLADLGLRSAQSRVRIVLLGTHPDRWRPPTSAVAAFRARHDLPAGRWLVTVARLVPYKGIDTAIRVVAELAGAHPDLHYLVVGNGEDRARLRELAASLHVEDRVHLLTSVTDDELPGAYAAADIYVGLTRETDTDVEGFGIAFVEAAASALPVVATHTGGIPDAVANGVSGVLVAPDDVTRAAAEIDALLRDTARARAMGMAGRARVEHDLNWSRVIDDMRGIAEEVGRGRRIPSS